jgi:hypothetical protein
MTKITETRSRPDSRGPRHALIGVFGICRKLSAYVVALYQGNLLLTLRVVINAFHATRHLIETNVVEALKTCAVDGLHPMVRDQKVLLPAHEEVFFLHQIFGHQLRPRRVFGEGLICRELGPVLPIDLLVGPPLRMLRYECVFASNDLAFEVRGEARVVFGQPCGALDV